MYLIGIDISKYKHDCFIATEAGNQIKAFSFDNNRLGFDLFLEVFKIFRSVKRNKNRS